MSTLSRSNYLRENRTNPTTSLPASSASSGQTLPPNLRPLLNELTHYNNLIQAASLTSTSSRAVSAIDLTPLYKQTSFPAIILEEASSNLPNQNLFFTSNEPASLTTAQSQIVFTQVATLLPTAEEISSSIEINFGPYDNLTNQKVAEIVKELSPPTQLEENSLQEAYQENHFFSEEMTNKLDMLATLPENRAKIEKHFGQFEITPLPHSQAISPPFQRGHLSRAHLLAMTIFLDAFEKGEDLLFVCKDATKGGTEKENAVFSKEALNAFRKMLSTHIGQILFLRIRKKNVPVFLEEAEKGVGSKFIPLKDTVGYKIQLSLKKCCTFTFVQPHQLKLYTPPLAQTLFHELFHAFQRAALREWPKDIPFSLEEYSSPIELFAISPVLEESRWFCEAGFSLETNNEQRSSHHHYCLSSIASSKLASKAYGELSKFLQLTEYLTDFEFEPKQEVRAIIISAILLHPDFSEWLDQNPLTREEIITKIKASPIHPLLKKTKEDLIIFFLQQHEDLENRNTYISKLLLSVVLKDFIKNHKQPFAFSNLSNLLSLEIGRDWLEENPSETVALAIACRTNSSSDPDAAKLRESLPLTLDVIKLLVDQEENEDLFYLLTKRTSCMVQLFDQSSNYIYAMQFLQSSSFQSLLLDYKEDLLPFLVTFQTSLFISSLQGTPSLSQPEPDVLTALPSNSPSMDLDTFDPNSLSSSPTKRGTSSHRMKRKADKEPIDSPDSNFKKTKHLETVS